jgi:hypothetical protein
MVDKNKAKKKSTKGNPNAALQDSDLEKAALVRVKSAVRAGQSWVRHT